MSDDQETPDAGAGLYRDNHTTPDTKTGKDIPPNQPEPPVSEPVSEAKDV